jgi:hypothetical protein
MAALAARKRAAGSGTVRASKSVGLRARYGPKVKRATVFDCPGYERFLLTIASLEEPL